MNYEQLSELIVTRLLAVIGSYESIMTHRLISYQPHLARILYTFQLAIILKLYKNVPPQEFLKPKWNFQGNVFKLRLTLNLSYNSSFIVTTSFEGQMTFLYINGANSSTCASCPSLPTVGRHSP